MRSIEVGDDPADRTFPIRKETNLMQTSKVSTPSFNKVLVATDLTTASNAAFQVALNICSDLGAELSVLHVFEYGAVSPENGGVASRINGRSGED